MEVSELPSIDPNTDFEKILPIQQKRIIAFINHFVTNTVSFLNVFAQSCESRLMEFEHKVQKVEASLLILESQLSSISGLDDNAVDKPAETKDEALELLPLVDEGESKEPPKVVEEEKVVQEERAGPKASEDARFVKYFKMVQFGVPAAAVKCKMEIEGLDSSILDKPNEVIPA